MSDFLGLESIKEILSLDKGSLKTAYTALSAFALWLTIALAVILIVAYYIVKYKANKKLASFKSVALGIVIGYAVTLSACILFFMIARLSVKEEIDTNFYLLLGFFGLCVAVAIAILVTKLISKKAFNFCTAIGITLIIAYAVVLVCVLPTVNDEYDGNYTPLSVSGMYIFSILLVLIIGALAFFFGKNEGTASPTKNLAYAGVAIALSYALSFIKLFSLPQGGSVTLASMLPLIIYSYAFGARKGVFAGIIYGVLQCLQSPQIYQPMQVLLDYPVAFGAIGLAGIAKNFKAVKKPLWQFIIGASIALLGRYAAHFLSGYYVFSSWAMEGYTALTWSLVYNLFVIVELAIVLFVGVFLFSSKGVVKQLTAINPPIDAVTSPDAQDVSDETQNSSTTNKDGSNDISKK